MTESNNIIIYPSYILPPYYSSDMHPAMKYGMLMATIGHELTHAVDNEGSKFYLRPENRTHIW